MKLFRKKKNNNLRRNKKEIKQQASQTKQHYRNAILGGTYLSMLVPDPSRFKGWRLHENYVEVVGKNPVNSSVFAPILIFIKPDKAELSDQWGVNFIQDLVTDTLENTVDTHGLNVMFISNIRQMTKDWVNSKQDDSERYSLKTVSSNKEKAIASMQNKDLNEIATELAHGARYLAVGLKYVVAATSVARLDNFMESLQRRLELKIPGIIVTYANGNIENEVATIFNNPMDEPGKKLMFTSREFAGFYNIVTNGIEDPHGFYAGEQIGDISNSAIIWDMNNFANNAIIATGNKFRRKRDFKNNNIPDDYIEWTSSDLWLNTLILQLVKEQPLVGPKHHVFTLALDPIHLDDKLITTTSVIDLNKGHLNPFEMFGDVEDELEIFPANLAKWHEMTRQLAQQEIKVDNEFTQEQIGMTELTDLDDTLTQFYIDNNMWVKNPAENRDKLRAVGIPSEEVPTLTEFLAYLTSAYHQATDPDTGDQQKAQEYNKLLALYRQLDLANGDLFNTTTDPQFTNLRLRPHTLLNYSKLSERKGNILLVQLLNSFSAIANQAHEGDTIILHGAQRITSITQKYITGILHDLRNRGVRIVFSYSSPSDMLKQLDFNQMPSADWTLTGHMTADECAAYNEALGNQRQMTQMIAGNIQSNNESCYYLRRGNDNVIFEANQSL